MIVILLPFVIIVIVAIVAVLYLCHYDRSWRHDRDLFDHWHDRYHRDL